MNFLAHAYLSFGHQEILVGNMISDFVKGKSRLNYSEFISKGIMLHREIDCFTDSHAATSRAKQIFRADYRLYSGAIVDIVYDHFLGNDRDQFSEQSLERFSRATYTTLENHLDQLPLIFQHIFPFMKKEDWLFQYRTNAGIEKSIRGLVRRAKYLSDADTAYRLFLTNHEELGKCYELFFPDVKQFAKQRVEELLA